MRQFVDDLICPSESNNSQVFLWNSKAMQEVENIKKTQTKQIEQPPIRVAQIFKNPQGILTKKRNKVL